MGSQLTQRGHARRLDVALGLTSLHLERLAPRYITRSPIPPSPMISADDYDAIVVATVEPPEAIRVSGAARRAGAESILARASSRPAGDG